MKHLPKINKADYGLVPVNPDPGFSPEHNRSVIDSSIKKYEAMRAKKRRNYEETISERTSALATYLKSTEGGVVNSNIHKYFGERELNRLRGVDVLTKMNEAIKDAKIRH